MPNDEQQLHYRTLHRRIRPARVATIFPLASEGWEASALRMMENLSITWGGLGNILIPVAASGEVDEALWPLVELFDADTWAAYTLTWRGYQLADPDQFRQWLNREARKWARKHGGGIAKARETLTAAHLMEHAVGGWPPPDEFVKELQRRTGPAAEAGDLVFSAYRADGPPGHHIVDICDLEPLPGRVRILDTHRWPAAVQLMVAMRCGGLAPTHIQRLLDAGVAVESVLLDDRHLDLALRLSWFGSLGTVRTLSRAFMTDPGPLRPFEEADFLSTTPLAVSAVGCGRMWRWAPAQDDLPVVVVAGDTAVDFCYALALDRCGVRSVWLPAAYALGSGDFAGSVVESLTMGFQSVGREWDKRPKVLCSRSLSRAELGDVARRLKKTSWGSLLEIDIVDRADLPPYRQPALLDPSCFNEPLEEPFVGDEMARGVPAALPSAVRSTDPWKLTWWSEVTDSRRQLPARAALNDLVVASSQGWRAIARSGRDGISYFSHTMGFVSAGASLEQMAERPRLRFPSVAVAFTHLLERAGFTAVESPAGRFRRLATSLWGDLASLAADVKDPQRLRLLRGWLSVAKSGEEPGILTNSKRRYLSFGDAVALSGLAEADARQLLDSYLDREIIRRGYALKCPHCLHFEWYDLGALDQRFTCQRCRTSSVLTSSTWRLGEEPTPYYDLAEVVLQAFRGNAEVPVRALAALESVAQSFAHAPELEVTSSDGMKIEVDLLAVADGRLILGEAKTGDVLHATARAENAWLSRLAHVARCLAADEVIFATASPAWRPATETRIRRMFPTYRSPALRLVVGV